MGLHFSQRRCQMEPGHGTPSEPQGHESLPLKHFSPQSNFSPVLCLKSPSRTKNCHSSFLCLSAGNNMSITQEMDCSYPALLNNCAMHSFLRNLLLILICIIMWHTEHKTQVICVVIASCILHKAEELSSGARKIEQVQHEEAGE